MDIVQVTILVAMIFVGICGMGYFVLRPLGPLLKAKFVLPTFQLSDVFCLFILLQIPCSLFAWSAMGPSYQRDSIPIVVGVMLTAITLTVLVWVGVLAGLTGAGINDAYRRSTTLLVILPTAFMFVPGIVVYNVSALWSMAPRSPMEAFDLRLLLIVDIAAAAILLAARRLGAWVARAVVVDENQAKSSLLKLAGNRKIALWSVVCWMISAAGIALGSSQLFENMDVDSLFSPRLYDKFPRAELFWNSTLELLVNATRVATAVLLPAILGCILGIASGFRSERRIRRAILLAAILLLIGVCIAAAAILAFQLERNSDNKVFAIRIIASAALCGVVAGGVFGWRGLRGPVWSMSYVLVAVVPIVALSWFGS